VIVEEAVERSDPPRSIGVRGRLGIVVPGLALVLFWSSGFVGAELGAKVTEPLTLLSWRFAIGTVILLGICAVVRPHLDRHEIGRQAVIGLLSVSIYLASCYIAVRHGVLGGTVSLLAALQPLLVAVAAGPLLGEHTSRRQRVGLGIGLPGVIAVVSGGLRIGAAPWWAYLLPVLGVVSLSAGTLLGRHWRGGSLLVSLTTQTGTGAVTVMIAAALTGELAPPMTAGFGFAVGWTALLSGLGGYGAFLLVLRRQGAAAVGTWLYLSPPTTMIWTWVMFGDRIGLLGVLGLMITAAGVVLAISHGRGPRGSSGLSGERPVELHRVHVGGVGEVDHCAFGGAERALGQVERRQHVR
jgi:drug/metabolite transporter (DMT)-like permease